MQRTLESTSNGELDHRATSHVDGVGGDAAVHFCGVHFDGHALLEHVLAVVEGLKDEDLDHADGCSDRRVLEFGKLSRPA